jgi:hypothetical protein
MALLHYVKALYALVCKAFYIRCISSLTNNNYKLNTNKVRPHPYSTGPPMAAFGPLVFETCQAFKVDKIVDTFKQLKAICPSLPIPSIADDIPV